MKVKVSGPNGLFNIVLGHQRYSYLADGPSSFAINIIHFPAHSESKVVSRQSPEEIVQHHYSGQAEVPSYSCISVSNLLHEILPDSEEKGRTLFLTYIGKKQCDRMRNGT